MPAASMKQLLESGVHFGHQTRRWNPKMKPYIFTERGGIHIIDLQQTTVLLDRAYDFVRNIAGRGGIVLFVGTKKQCQDIIRDEASRVGMPYVSHRWLGGLLTNFSTIENRIKRMHELRALKEEGQLALLPTKERMAMERELEKLEVNLGGVSNMTRLPDAVFVADPKREAIATKEVNKLGLPLIGLVDTNCDPDEVDYLIPGNDDAIRSCGLIIRTLAQAVEEGRQKIQVAEFSAAEAGKTAVEGQAEKVPARGDETERPAPSEAPPSRVSRVSRPAGGEGRQGARGRAGESGRTGGAGRGGSSGRTSGAARRTSREDAPREEASTRKPAATKAASATATKGGKEAADATTKKPPAEKASGPKQPAEQAAPEQAAPEQAAPEQAAPEQAAPAVENAPAEQSAPAADTTAEAKPASAAAAEVEGAAAPETVDSDEKGTAADDGAEAQAGAETGAETDAEPEA